MQTTWRRSSKMHRTAAGRVVYDRPKHSFSTRDLVRVAKAIEPADLVGMLDLLVVLSELILALIPKMCSLLGYSVAFTRLYPIVRRLIADVWLALTNNASTPPVAQGRITTEGGLSLL